MAAGFGSIGSLGGFADTDVCWSEGGPAGGSASFRFFDVHGTLSWSTDGPVTGKFSSKRDSGTYSVVSTNGGPCGYVGTWTNHEYQTGFFAYCDKHTANEH
eukprot:TRINITY_DN18130_c0_g1_i3.p4 TRINITY_DN18130_c0_g1~~TRINITY_DN18130_c0_g1_i3.p4  ORF type:complete len:101 (-),score=14.42 TRINITY_DN18130_c0_g1_i3:227-529(-)